MPSRFNPNPVPHALYLGYLSIIPSLLLPDIFPFLILPAAVLSGYAAERFFHARRLKTIPSAAALSALTFLLYAGLRLAAGLFKDSLISETFLRAALTLYPLGGTALYALLSARWRRVSRQWASAEPLLLLALGGLSFWGAGGYRPGPFPHPLASAGYALGALLLAVAVILAAERKERRRPASLLFLFPFLLAAALLATLGFNRAAVSANGGLIKPTLFRFDFSPLLSLQSDISLNDRLVMIAHVPEEYQAVLIRRLHLSGWDPSKGFFESPEPGSPPQRLSLPPAPVSLDDPGYGLRETVRQEYFIVNFDPKSLLAMDYPVRIEPYKLWETSSFNGAYAVTSRVTGFAPFELYDAPAPLPSGIPGLPGEAYSFYTNLDEDTRSYVEPIAQGLTEGIESYYDRILAMSGWLRSDAFRYSLHPGEARDGNQLRHFLTESRKGYCTYYAFSLALLCRSIGIPARVAAGFFISPQTGALDYYPIRSNQAHAWVEVFFPGYGWISFDPTNQILAEGESLQPGGSPRGDDFMGLLDEIMEKKGELALENLTLQDAETPSAGILSRIKTLFRKSVPGLALVLVLTALLPLLLPLLQEAVLAASKNPRRVILLAARLAPRRGKKPEREELTALREELKELAGKARFSSRCGEEDRVRALEILRLLRRGRKKGMHALLLVAALLAPTAPIDAQELPQTAVPGSEASQRPEAAQLMERANRAIAAENWDLATSLLLEGKKTFPRDGNFPYRLGSLFLDQNLYPAAIRELETARDLGFSDSEIYLKLSDAAGYENRDEESLLWLRRYLALVPDNLSAWSTFGWLCYKTHRLDEGISTLTRVLETWGPDGNLYVGLANLYSAAYDYRNARENYTLAVDLANREGQQYLASVYLYNRSILEETFYRFDSAYKDTERSLDASPRASGYLMQAELEMRKLSYRLAMDLYLKAKALDSTPLASIGLGETLLKAGYPELGNAQFIAVQSNQDRSWIANYGTTLAQFSSDMARLEREYWKFMKHKEKRKVVHSFSTFISKSASVILYGIMEWIQDARYRLSILDVGKTYQRQEKAFDKEKGEGLYEHSYKYMAFDRWKELALPHLSRAEAIETGHISLAQPSYDYEKGALRGDTQLLDRAISSLDPLWERNYLSLALANRIKLTNLGENNLKEAYAQRLLRLDPAQFIFEDLSLPIQFDYGPSVSPDLRRILEKYLKTAGFHPVSESTLILSIALEPEKLTLSLRDNHGLITNITQVIHKRRASPQEITEAVNNFSTRVFQTSLE